MGLVGAKN